MNEHDSERIAGLLAADGLVAADGIDDADVVVLNTCCIRENADNKLYGHLGHLKSLKDRNPDLQIVVGGCLAQKDRDAIVDRARHVDVVFGTHNVHRAAELVRESAAAGRSIVEILDETVADDHAAFPSALPAQRELPWAGWVTIQIGCDNTCAFCIVPAVRGREISRTPDDVLAEVTALAADGVSRDHPAGPERQQLRARPCARGTQGGGHDRVRPCSPTCSAPSARSTASGGCATPARTPRTCGPRRSPPWPRRRRCASTCTCRCRPGSDATLAAMHRGYTAERYLARLAAARAAIPDLAVTTDLIVGFPGETDDDFERTLEVVAEAAYDSAYTFLFSPAREPRLPRGSTTSCLPRSPPSASSACASWSSGQRWRATRRGSAASRRCSSRARSRKDPDRAQRVAPGRTSSSTSRGRRVGCVPAASSTCASPPPRRITCAASSSPSPRRRRTARASPSQQDEETKGSRLSRGRT